MATKAELVDRVLELEKLLASMTGDVVDAVQGNTDEVIIVRDPEISGGVLLTAPNGVIIVSAEDWMDAVCRVSVGGNNHINQGIVRRLHLG